MVFAPFSLFAFNFLIIVFWVNEKIFAAIKLGKVDFDRFNFPILLIDFLYFWVGQH